MRLSLKTYGCTGEAALGYWQNRERELYLQLSFRIRFKINQLKGSPILCSLSVTWAQCLQTSWQYFLESTCARLKGLLTSSKRPQSKRGNWKLKNVEINQENWDALNMPISVICKSCIYSNKVDRVTSF